MNESNKTSRFLEAINRYAKEQSDAILQEVEEFKKQEIEKATKEAITDAYVLIQKTIAVEKSKIVSEFAKKEQDSKRELFIKRQEIVEEVFEKATKKLVDFTKTDEYKEYMIKSAKEIAQQFADNGCVVYVKADDMAFAQDIKGIISNCEIVADEKITIGGIKGYCEKLSVIADNTLDSKLSYQREWFVENSELKVV